MNAPPSITPERIVDIATGYMAAKQLFAASRIGLFAALATGDRNPAELAAATGAPERTVRILADALNAEGLLDRRDGRYSLSPDAAEYLGGSGGVDLAPFLAFLNEVSYQHWLQFDATVDAAEPGLLERTPAVQAMITGGVQRYFALHAAMLARALDFTRYRSVLDVGGLTPEFANRARCANPRLRVEVVPATSTDAVPGGPYDAVMVNHVIHRFSAETNREILTRARAAAATGATLILVDFLLDDGERQRSVDARHAGEYAVIDGTIVYPLTEVREWLAASGWRPRQVIPLPGGPRAVVADAATPPGDAR